MKKYRFTNGLKEELTKANEILDISKKEILKLKKEKKELEEMWEEFTMGMWKKNALPVKSARILQGKSQETVLQQLEEGYKHSEDELLKKAIEEIKYLQKEISIQKTLAEVSVKYGDLLKKLSGL